MAISTTPPALPVWQTVKESYASVFANWPAVLKMSWAWLLIVWLARVMLPLPTQDAPRLTVGSVIAVLLYLALVSAGTASIAVAWHRLFFLGEQPPALYLRLGGQVPRYLVRLLLIEAIAGAIAFGLGLLLILSMFITPVALLHLPSNGVAPQFTKFLIFLVFGFPVLILTTLVVARISVGLPGFAIERPVSFGKTMKVTRGNVWRLGWGAALVSLPGYVLNFLFGMMVSESAPTTDFISLIIWTIPLLAFISVCYRFFFRNSLE